MVKDNYAERYHLFLVPSLGDTNIVEMHKLLYEDKLESELRKDIPYVAHITIGIDESKEKLNQLASKLQSKGFKISGTVNSVSVVQLQDGKIVEISKTSLL